MKFERLKNLGLGILVCQKQKQQQKLEAVHSLVFFLIPQL